MNSNVKVWEEKVTIPTYPVGKPDKNPMFLEKRVYQGSSGKVYPHTVIDKIFDNKMDKEYTAVFLENDYIKVMILPEIGGRIQRATDKTNGYDFVYYNHVIKPALVGLAGPVPLTLLIIRSMKMMMAAPRSLWVKLKICFRQREWRKSPFIPTAVI